MSWTFSFLSSVDGGVLLASKSESKLRWLILFCACFLMIGPFYTYDEPAALKTQIGQYMDSPEDYETLFSLLYSVYSFPNIILPFFGGYLVDRYRARNCAVLYAMLILVGNIVFAVGMSTKQWGVMYLGRFLDGCGGISVCIAANTLLAEWFTGKELALAFGFILAFCRMGGVTSNLCNPRVVDSSNVVMATWVGVLLCVMSLICALAVIPMDLNAESRLKIPEEPEGGLSLVPMHKSVAAVEETSDGAVREKQSLSGSADSPVYRRAGAVGCRGADLSDAPLSPMAVCSRLTEAKNFSPLFWLLCVSCMTVYGCVFPFNNVASSLLLERNYFMEQPNSECALIYDAPGDCQNATNVPNQYCNNGTWYQPPVAQGAEVDCTDSPACYAEYCDDLQHAELQAALIMSIPYLITGALCPFFGALVDKYGQRALALTVSPAAMVVVHLLVGFSSASIIGLLVGQGIAYCIYAAVLWSSISVVTEPGYYGMGYGFVFSFQQFGTALFPIAVAQIYTASGNTYIPNVELMFVFLAAVATCCGVAMFVVNQQMKGSFNAPSSMTADSGLTAVNQRKSLSDQEDE